MKLAVIYATLGRSEILAGALAFLLAQTRQADRIIITAVSSADVPELPPGLPIEVVFGPKGLAHQRNTGLKLLGKSVDAVVFFDDDFAPAPGFLATFEAILTDDSRIAGVTGHVLADGIRGPGYTFAEAGGFLAGYQPPALAAATRKPITSLYGCNMAVRLSMADGLTFEEALPLYAWQEDIDFTFQVSRRGSLIWTDALGGVHLGVKQSRTSGVRMGYSQIANPIFLWRKRTMPLSHAYKLMAKNLAANVFRSIRPEPWCDRRGRFVGNMLALGDLFRGRLHPQNILQLK